jgi:hypothetical protein
MTRSVGSVARLTISQASPAEADGTAVGLGAGEAGDGAAGVEHAATRASGASQRIGDRVEDI